MFSFWKKFYRKVKAVKEDALLVGENWFYAPSYLQGDEWDSLMNYHFTDAVLGFVVDGTVTATEFVGRLGFMWGTIHSETYEILWNLIDCHDILRFKHLVKNRSNRQMFAYYYKKLLAPRKSEPCIVHGIQRFLSTDDENGLLIEERSIRDGGKKDRQMCGDDVSQ